MIDKTEIISNLCYTDLVYGRINKKLKTNYSCSGIEKLIEQILVETEPANYCRKGKNYYIVNTERKIRLTINSNTFRIITADTIT